MIFLELLERKQLKLCVTFESLITGRPPCPPYVGSSLTVCHLLRKKADLCCLRLNQECVHSTATQISSYNFEKKAIILAAENCNNGIYNFIVPLRSHTIEKQSMHPILLMFETEYVILLDASRQLTCLANEIF